MAQQQTLLNYRRRKTRTNTALRSQKAEYRCIVSRSLKHISAQILDQHGSVLVCASDASLTSGTKKEKAAEVGKILASAALKKKIDHCVFDRNGFLYHGRVQALCEAAREGGLKI